MLHLFVRLDEKNEGCRQCRYFQQVHAQCIPEKKANNAPVRKDAPPQSPGKTDLWKQAGRIFQNLAVVCSINDGLIQM